MHRVLLLCTAALPAAGLADDVFEVTPKPQPYQIVDIDYWGTITEVTDGSRRVGEPVAGSMRIDMRYAPPDRSQFPEAEYTWIPRCDRNCPDEIDAPSRFLTTSGAPVELDVNSYDRVLVFDDFIYEPFEPTVDRFDLEDWEVGRSANVRVTLDVASSVVDFIHGVGLLQEFDLRPPRLAGIRLPAARGAYSSTT